MGSSANLHNKEEAHSTPANNHRAIDALHSLTAEHKELLFRSGRIGVKWDGMAWGWGALFLQSRVVSACWDLVWSFSWVLLTYNAKSWELGWKGTSTLLRLLIRSAFGAIRVLINLHFKMSPLWENGHKQVFGLIVSYFESFGFHWFFF